MQIVMVSVVGKKTFYLFVSSVKQKSHWQYVSMDYGCTVIKRTC